MKAVLYAVIAALAVNVSPSVCELFADEDRPDQWRAWAFTEGKETKLVVEGIYRQGGPGTVVLVREATPQGINPKILILEAKTATLPGVWPAILLPVPAHYVKTGYQKDTYESIEIRYSNKTTIRIPRIIDTGSGPK